MDGISDGITKRIDHLLFTDDVIKPKNNFKLMYGDLTDSCKSACAHFNPYNKQHGGPTSKDRHVGDLGNIHFDAKGVSKFRMEDGLVKLRGTKANVIGRSVVIHEDMDD